MLSLISEGRVSPMSTGFITLWIGEKIAQLAVVAINPWRFLVGTLGTFLLKTENNYFVFIALQV